ncbi:MAG: tryptophan 7-halogenase, partial [Psychrosphaera sp.]|nr:tryptophan 7-halogenase [Psychrosphaera sp.]
LPESLNHALALFKSHGRQPDYDEGLIAKYSWVAAFTGLGVWPENCHPLTATVDVNKVAKEFALMRHGIVKTVESMPGHQDFIRRFCGA